MPLHTLITRRAPIAAQRALQISRNASNSRGPYIDRPGPIPLPADEQREFEEMIRKVNTPLAASSQADSEEVVEFHPDIRRGPPPQFKGEINPKTGEVGGPKTEPVAWNDWSYGGRATDF